MSDAIILAIDQGTTGTTVLALDSKLKILSSATREFRQVFPKPGWVEHEADAIWQSLKDATESCLQQGNIDVSKIAGIGITNQRETTCLFDQDSQSVHNFIVWQCRRTADICRELKEAGHETLFWERTGLVLDPYFSGTKLKWLFDNVEGSRDKAAAGELLFGTIDTWLVHKLSGGLAHVTDATNASRTLMMDLRTCKFDPELLEILDIPAACLPSICSSSEIYARTKGLGFLPDDIPIAGIAGDQQAALFGQACFAAGQAKCTYGTGCFLLLNTGEEIVRSQNGLLTTVAIKIGDEVQYALEGAAFVAGAAVQWLRDGLEMIESAEEIEALAATVKETGDVVFVPALAGLGAPHWRSEARGLLMGLTRDTNRGHIARAVLEGIAFQNRDILDAMLSEGGTLASLNVDGGASANDLLMQFQADLLGVECVRPQNLQTTALGAGALAGLAVGVFASRDEVAAVWQEEARFVPHMEDAEQKRHLEKWAKACERA